MKAVFTKNEYARRYLRPESGSETRRLFRDPDLERRFRRDGYIVVPLLDASQVERLAAAYLETLAHAPSRGPFQGFHASMHSRDAAYRRRVRDEIRRVAAAPALAVVDDCRFVSANFVVKEAHVQGEMAMHQDWAVVDESRFTSVAVWCPLVDVDEVNGNLWVLRASHENVVAWRGETAPGLPSYFPICAAAITARTKAKYQDSLRLRAGEAVMYDHRLVHFSPPNRTAETRIAFNICLAPTEARLVHYYRTGEQTIDLIAVDENFFTDFNIGERPSGEKIGEVPYRFAVLYPEQRTP